jgi:hypothetical protein
MSNIESSLASQLLPMATNTQQAETLNRSASANKTDYPQPPSTERAGVEEESPDTVNPASDDDFAVRTGQQRREDFREVLDRRMADKSDRPEKTEGSHGKPVSKDTGKKQQESTEAAAAAVSQNLHVEVSNFVGSHKIDPKELAQKIAAQKAKSRQSDPKTAAAMTSFKNINEKAGKTKEFTEPTPEMTEKGAAW